MLLHRPVSARPPQTTPKQQLITIAWRHTLRSPCGFLSPLRYGSQKPCSMSSPSAPRSGSGPLPVWSAQAIFKNHATIHGLTRQPRGAPHQHYRFATGSGHIPQALIINPRAAFTSG